MDEPKKSLTLSELDAIPPDFLPSNQIPQHIFPFDSDGIDFLMNLVECVRKDCYAPNDFARTASFTTAEAYWVPVYAVSGTYAGKWKNKATFEREFEEKEHPSGPYVRRVHEEVEFEGAGEHSGKFSAYILGRFERTLPPGVFALADTENYAGGFDVRPGELYRPRDVDARAFISAPFEKCWNYYKRFKVDEQIEDAFRSKSEKMLSDKEGDLNDTSNRNRKFLKFRRRNSKFSCDYDVRITKNVFCWAPFWHVKNTAFEKTFFASMNGTGTRMICTLPVNPRKRRLLRIPIVISLIVAAQLAIDVFFDVVAFLFCDVFGRTPGGKVFEKMFSPQQFFHSGTIDCFMLWGVFILLSFLARWRWGTHPRLNPRKRMKGGL